MGTGTAAGARQVLSGDIAKSQAQRLLQATNPPDSVLVLTLDLSIARLVSNPLTLGGYRSVYVASATDSLATIGMQINNQLPNNNPFPLFRHDVFQKDSPWAQCFLSWAAQGTKTMQLVLFPDALIQPGSISTTVSGQVSVIQGSGFVRTLVPVIHKAAAVALFTGAAGVLQQSCINDSGIDLYVGESATIDDGTGAAGVNKGQLWPDRTLLSIKNTGTLYVYNPDGALDLTVASGKALVVITES